MDNCSKVILQQYWNRGIDNTHLFASTEYPQIVGKVAASRTKNEDESPVVIIAVPSVTLDEITEKHPSSSLHCSSSQEQHKSLGENINKNLDDTEQMPGVSWALRHMKYRDKGATGLKPVDAVWLDNVQGVTYVLEDLKTKSSSVPSQNKISEPTFTENQEKKNQIAHCKLNSSTVNQIHNVLSVTTNQINQLCNQTSYEVAREDLCSVCPQTDVRIALSENNVKEQASLFEGEGKEGSYVRFLKDPKYEDISDNEDMPQLDTKLPVPERGDLSVAIRFEDLQYEDISEDENSQTGNMTLERTLLTQAPESEKYVHVQVLEDEDETDDEMGDDWIVIPIEISGLRFEPENEYCKNQEKVVPIDGASGDKTQLDPGPTHRDCNRPAPALSSQIEVFDTRESFLKAQGVQFPSICEVALGCQATEYEVDALGEPQNKRDLASDTEDSSQTEDSYDYSSGSELNFMTPSRKSWNKGLAADEKKVEGEVEQKLEQLIQAEAASKPVQQNTNGQKTSKIATIIIDSDTEDESDQNCKKKAESKGWFSDSDSNEHSHCSQQKRHSPGIVGSRSGTVKKFRKKKLNCTEKNGQLIKTKGASDHVQQNIQKSSKNETYDIVILDSDSDQNCNEVNGRRLFSSGSAEGDDAPCVQQRKHSAETVDGKTAKEKLREAQLSSTGSSLPQHKSELCYSRIKKATQDARSDLSHGTEKKRQLVEAKSDSGHVQLKTNRPRIPEQRENAKRRLSSRSEDNDDALFAIKSRHSAETVDSICQTTNKKPKTTRLSSEVQKKQPQSVEKEVDSTLGLNPLMPRLVNQQSSQPMEGLKLLQCTVRMEGDDKTQVPKTPTETCKKTAGTALHSHRNKKVRFETPANDGTHLTKNMVQAIVEKSKRSFPCQESPAPFSSSSIHDSCREARPGPSHYDRAPRQRHNSPRVSNPTETRYVLLMSLKCILNCP